MLSNFIRSSLARIMKIKISGVGVILMLVIRANVIFNRTPLFKKKYFQGSENWVDNMSTDDNIPSPDWSGAAWYRFLPPAGTRMPDYPPGVNKCATKLTGWISDRWPETVGESQQVTYCFDGDFIDPARRCLYPVNGAVTNCGEFLVYYLPDTTSHSKARYCAINQNIYLLNLQINY